MLERRSFLTAPPPSPPSPPASARAAFAAAPSDRRFVLLLLRGGLDGLHALPPHGDRDYRRLRPTLALSPDPSPRSRRPFRPASGARRSHAALPGGRTAARPGRRHPLSRPIPFRRAEHAGERQRQTLWRTGRLAQPGDPRAQRRRSPARPGLGTGRAVDPAGEGARPQLVRQHSRRRRGLPRPHHGGLPERSAVRGRAPRRPRRRQAGGWHGRHGGRTWSRAGLRQGGRGWRPICSRNRTARG